MREIKFRAWDGKKFGFIQINGNLIGWPTADWMDQTPLEACVRLDGVVAVDQYTGIKDKNGKEIYEGDILATWNKTEPWDSWTKKDCGYTVVEWSDERDGFQGSKWTWEKDEDDSSVYCMRFIEVIGNIHESTELLKEGASQ